MRQDPPEKDARTAHGGGGAGVGRERGLGHPDVQAGPERPALRDGAALQLHELPSARDLGGMLCIVTALGASALASSVRGPRA